MPAVRILTTTQVPHLIDVMFLPSSQAKQYQLCFSSDQPDPVNCADLPAKQTGIYINIEANFDYMLHAACRPNMLKNIIVQTACCSFTRSAGAYHSLNSYRATAELLVVTCGYLLHAACYLLPVTCYLLPATCYLLPATCYLLPATCYLLPATCYLLLPAVRLLLPHIN